MRLALFTPTENLPGESHVLTHAVELGVDYIHVRKPALSEIELALELSVVLANQRPNFVFESRRFLFRIGKSELIGLHVSHGCTLV